MKNKGWNGEKHRHSMASRGIKTNYTSEEIRIANMTSRTSPNKKSGPGTSAVVPKMVLSLSPSPDEKILDFGAGRYPKYAIELKDLGLDVTAYEFGDNYNPEYHDKDALKREYDIVYASNVLNVQSSKKMLINTLNQIRDSTRHGGLVVLNYPSKPRKMDMSTKEMKEILEEYFNLIAYDDKNHAYIGRHIYGTMGAKAWTEYDRMREQGKRYAETGDTRVFRRDNRLEVLK